MKKLISIFVLVFLLLPLSSFAGPHYLGGNDRYIMAFNEVNMNGTLAVALTAMTAKLNVRLLVDNDLCTVGNPTFKSIELKP